MKPLAIITLSLIPFCMINGALIVNGDMSSTTYATGGNDATFAAASDGWAVKSTTGLSLTANPGELTWNRGDTTLLTDSLAQINPVSTETGNALILSLEWTPASGSTFPTLEYNVVGWKVSGTPVDGDIFFNNINGGGDDASGLSGNADAVDLRTGINYGTGKSSMSVGTLTGTAGFTTNAAVTIDMSGYESGLSDIGDYDYIGVRFKIAGDQADLSSKGSLLDNVSLTPTSVEVTPSSILSYDTGYTIQKVRTATLGDETILIGSSYEGTVLGMDYHGTVLWTNALSGFMNHDLWCDDLTDDDADEILVASADGSLYCLNATGEQQWQFKPNDGGQLPPMYAVCVVHSNGTPYVVCGPYDMSIYYLDSTGALVKEIKSSTYSKERPWEDEAKARAGYAHNANFLRPIPQPDGSEVLAVLGTMNHMQSKGSIYLFEAMADLPFSTNTVSCTDMIGDFRVCDPDGDGTNVVLLGSSGLNEQGMTRFDPETGAMDVYDLSNLGDAGYRVTQVETIPDGDSFQYFMLCGSVITLGTPSVDTNVVSSVEQLSGTYAYNDLWKDPSSGKIILASAQSGGSCIHIIDTSLSTWKTDFAKISPPGKIQTIIDNTASARTDLETFSAPSWERAPRTVYETQGDATHAVAQNIAANYSSPIFLDTSSGHRQDPLDWDRDTVLADNPTYRDKRDNRSPYDWTQAQVLAKVTSSEDGGVGHAMWGGHGNDPYYYSPETLKKIIDLADGDKTVQIWPEMNGSSDEFGMVMDHLFYPLADYARTNNANIMIRNKNIFWQGAVYLPAWAKMVAGDYSEVFVSALEETTDKTQDLSVAGRMGIWASGAMDNWGMRCSRDNPSFDRQRQHSYQRLPNHFLRNMVYNIASGATYLNVTYVDTDYMSFAWELIATGALYIPKRSEIVSFSPVHLSITDPDEHYLDDGENNKWTTFYDRDFEENNPYVFSHMNGTWPAAPVTEWDFSRYASGVKDRRQNFLPPYPNGMVLITPPQQGIFADTNATRSALQNYLHPLYTDILDEYITDGHEYLSSDGTTHAANTYYTTVAEAIAAGAQKLPLTVSGDVAWVCAQTSSNHLRLTLVDSGYLNPKERTATVTFHTVTPAAITDLLTGETFGITSPVAIDVPLGLFRFLDIELDAPFYADALPQTGWDEFKKDYGITEDTADTDGDGVMDLAEYGLGGNPKSAVVTGEQPSIEFDGDTATFIHLQRSSADSGISYLTQWTEDLVNGSWNTTWSFTTNTVSSSEFNQFNYQVGGEKTKLFFRLKITRP